MADVFQLALGKGKNLDERVRLLSTLIVGLLNALSEESPEILDSVLTFLHRLEKEVIGEKDHARQENAVKEAIGLIQGVILYSK
jgi:hypothetical protein